VPATPEAAPPAAPPRRRRWLAAGVALVAVLAVAAGVWLWVGRTVRRPNLLLVTIDTLRADHVGAYGYAPAPTPVLDGLARRGVRFDAVQTAAPLTGPSHATILTGQYPPVHGLRNNARFTIDAKATTLAERLKRAGWRTAAFVAAYPVAAAFGFGRGFDTFSEGLTEAKPGYVAERRGDAVADAAIAWLQSLRGTAAPFFAWVHFYDPHLPYDPPQPYRGRFASAYDGEIAFADAQLGRVLDELRASGREADTVVLVLADHGEGLGDHGEAAHGLLLYESTLRVPFVAAGPGVRPGLVVRQRVGTIDLVPTALALLGLPAAGDLPGRSLKPLLAGKTLQGETLYAESLYGHLACRWATLRAFTDGDSKLVTGGSPELFDLASDPREERNRAAADPARAAQLHQALDAALAEMAPGGDRIRTATVTTEQLERLRSLGYVAGGGGAEGALDDPSLPDPRPRVHLLERLEAIEYAAGASLRPALAEALRIAEQEDGNPYAHLVVAGLASRGGELALAEEALTRSLALDPGRTLVRAQLGALLRRRGKLADSERELRLAVAEGPADDWTVQVGLAETLIEERRLDEAEAILSRVLAASPNHEAALAARGRLRVLQGRGDEALAALERAASGGRIDAVLELADAELSLGRTESAREAAGRVLERSNAHPWALGIAGHALVLEGQKEEGLRLLERALEAGPRRARVWQRLAAGFEAAGRGDLATRCRASAARGR
jgi:arylsulfatase A-like enzyme/Tfp pilus assembly protein PilF